MPLTPLEKALEALAHLNEFEADSDYDENSPLFLCPDDALYELPHAEGQFTLGEFRALVAEHEDLKFRMDGLKK